LQKFLKTNGFEDVNGMKKLSNFGRYTLPLHTAVEQNNAEMVKILLENKADVSKLSKNKKTALDKAEKLNLNGSHDKIIIQLKSHKTQARAA
jgi:hypothetical protein